MTADSDNSDNPRSSNFASALRDGRSHLRLWIVAAAGLWVDLWSKAWAFSTLDADHPMPVWEGFMEFRRSLNAGEGGVRDFIKFLPRLPTWIPLVGGFDAWPWIFNVADALLVCGVAILLLNLWFTRGPTPSTRRLQGNRRGDP